MKKIMKISKVFLLVATIFSYIASPISVLANEVISLPLAIDFEAVFDEEGYVDSYKITYDSENDVYDVEKDYKIEYRTTFTYDNENEIPVVSTPLIVSLTGEELNNGGSQVFNPISKYYNGVYELVITVYDDNDIEVYSDNYIYDYDTFVGLTGKLNGVEAEEEINDVSTIGNYDVTLGEIYTQTLNVLTGELSPNGMYRIVYEAGTYSEVMTGDELRTNEITGTITDLNGKFAGTYSYTDTITIEELVEDSVVNTYTYNYEANLECDGDNDAYLNTLYEGMAIFKDGYMIVDAKEYDDAEKVITLGELVSVLPEGLTISIFDDENQEILFSEDVSDDEVKNNYVITFTSGIDVSYIVVVKGDITSDNIFNKEDLFNESGNNSSVLEGYINGDNIPSMDMITLEKEVEDSEELKREEFGTITFEDVIITNELLKGNGNVDKKVQSNENLALTFGELDDEIFVGNTIELDVLVNSENVDEYIDGIDAILTISDNIRLNEIVFNDLLTGTYVNDRVVAIGNELNSGKVVMTLVFDVVNDGTATVEIDGNVSKFLNITEMDTMIKEFDIIRNVSSNNNLSSLKASVGNFDVTFDKDVIVYTLTVPYNTDKVILSGSVEDSSSIVDGLIEYELEEDKTTAIITVTAEDGTVKTYTVYIIKEEAPVVTPIVYYTSSNNYLKSLSVDGYEIDFDKNTDEYRITVRNDVTSLDISAMAEDYRSRVEITGNEEFEEGENTVIITVTAEDGSVKEYKLIVEKEAKKQITPEENNSNNVERIIIIILIVLVVFGLLYLIFKKDDEEIEEVSVNKEKNKNQQNTINNKQKNNSKNNKKKK